MSHRILFMGTPEFSVPVLKTLSKNYEIVCVFTQPPKKNLEGKK